MVLLIYLKWEKNIPKQDNFAKYLVQNGVNNIINTDAFAIYSIRSSSSTESEKLKKKIEKIIDKINKKYKNLANVEVAYKKHLPMFEKAKELSTSEVQRKELEKNQEKEKRETRGGDDPMHGDRSRLRNNNGHIS